MHPTAFVLPWSVPRPSDWIGRVERGTIPSYTSSQTCDEGSPRWGRSTVAPPSHRHWSTRSPLQRPLRVWCMSSVSPQATDSSGAADQRACSEIGVIGLAVMGQNLALNLASKGISVSVYNRTASRTDETVARAQADADIADTRDRLRGFHDVAAFVRSLQRPRKVLLMVKAGAAVDATLAALRPLLEPGDILIDGGNEWYENTERRAQALAADGLILFGMGVSGGEDGARHGPSLMPGGPADAYPQLEPILQRIAAHVPGAGACVTYIGPGGAGNYVKMVHNGIEYGDMQLVGEAYDLLKTLGGLSNSQLQQVFAEWNQGELQSFLIEITADILGTRDDVRDDGAALIDRVLDRSGSKGTGMWTVQEAARRGVPVPTIAAALDNRYLSAMKTERVRAATRFTAPNPSSARIPAAEVSTLITDVRQALYCSKICSYAQGMNVLRAAAEAFGWRLRLGEIARIWQGGCIIRAQFLGRIQAAYQRDAALPNLLVDPAFAADMERGQASWRRVVAQAAAAGLPTPALSGSLAYYDTYRRAVLPASQLVQAQRDYFGAHTYARLDAPDQVWHTRWSSDKHSVRMDEKSG
ncbi:hypothetical protein CDCA_CDCA03G0879 [Cyanidium caldarium]|uniref:6-phosphogluconate dehydrogenase, decarboxylating n=1 Tax=Cyanidium caldarium TaxID=2771 RepID=A0AAV9IRB0_CYACA|nr:hypothetical protein CDCA_CDCA03G0879 [Cyanidium caldarium]